MIIKCISMKTICNIRQRDCEVNKRIAILGVLCHSFEKKIEFPIVCRNKNNRFDFSVNHTFPLFYYAFIRLRKFDHSQGRNLM